MKIEYTRGEDSNIYIVNNEGKYYLVNLQIRSCSLACPPNLPSMFLKFGYFKDVNDADIGEIVKTEIRNLIKNCKGDFK